MIVLSDRSRKLVGLSAECAAVADAISEEPEADEFLLLIGRLLRRVAEEMWERADDYIEEDDQ
jgi:hypothetical protein